METQICQILKAALNKDAETAKKYAEMIVQKYYNPKASFNSATQEEMIARMFKDILEETNRCILDSGGKNF